MSTRAGRRGPGRDERDPHQAERREPGQPPRAEAVGVEVHRRPAATVPGRREHSTVARPIEVVEVLGLATSISTVRARADRRQRGSTSLRLPAVSALSAALLTARSRSVRDSAVCAPASTGTPQRRRLQRTFHGSRVAGVSHRSTAPGLSPNCALCDTRPLAVGRAAPPPVGGSRRAWRRPRAVVVAGWQRTRGARGDRDACRGHVAEVLTNAPARRPSPRWPAGSIACPAGGGRLHTPAPATGAAPPHGGEEWRLSVTTLAGDHYARAPQRFPLWGPCSSAHLPNTSAAAPATSGAPTSGTSSTDRHAR